MAHPKSKIYARHGTNTSAAPIQAQAGVPEVSWERTAQKSVQVAKAKSGTAVEDNEAWAIRPAAPHPYSNQRSRMPWFNVSCWLLATVWSGFVVLEGGIVIGVVPPQQILFIGDRRKPRR